LDIQLIVDNPVMKVDRVVKVEYVCDDHQLEIA
jgi:hypothetical protein